MNRSRHSPRSGLSLTEVLVAIFVMGIGMLCLLVLFPVGLSNMKWALQDNRLALASQTAISQAESVQKDFTGQAFTLRSDPNYYAAANYIPDPTISNALLWWHPAAPPPGPYPGNPVQPAYDPTGPKPPVFVDSVGVLACETTATVTDTNPAVPLSRPNTGLPSRWGYCVGSRKAIPTDHDRITHPVLSTAFTRGALYGIPRIRSAHIAGLSDAIRACVQEDELTFGPNAQPPNAGSPSAVIERENRYSWAYMCRFPKGDDPNVVDMSIVLYSSRRMNQVILPGTDHTTGEQRYFGTPTNLNALGVGGVVFVKGSNEAVIDVYDPQNLTNKTANNVASFVSAPVASPFKKGDVILDNTLVMPDFATYAGSPPKRYYAPFDTQISLAPTAPAPILAGYGPPNPPMVRKGLANGFFYKVTHVGPVEFNPFNGHYFQRITLDRPALADGFEAVYLHGAIDVIEKSNGRLPMR